jgi:thiol-disulfide isomerase/thioredoxin
LNYQINYILFFFIIIIISCKEKIEKNKNQVLPTLVTLENKEFKLEELKGNVIILNLWATWCKPCIAEFKSLEKSKSLFKENNVKIIAVSNEPIDKISEFLKRKPFNLNYIKLNKDLSYFDVHSLPTTIVLDKNGKENFRITNSIDFTSKDFTDKIKKLEQL